ncbi:hypothetical protein [Aminobacter sp. BE322]|uniref:hypothetical protein n=1 Tax=unclassified Aminobacter TaxID=2644704 RepID=UPI003D1CBE66
MRAPGGTFGGNLDQVPERGFTGMALRLYDPRTGLWSIYWSDTRSFQLFPPMVGRFRDGRGELYGDDVEGGVPVRVRILWTGGENPRWGQAMSVDGGQAWEVNWVKRFGTASTVLRVSHRLNRVTLYPYSTKREILRVSACLDVAVMSSILDSLSLHSFLSLEYGYRSAFDLLLTLPQ